MAGCSAGSNGVPAIQTTLPKYDTNIASVTNGIITATSESNDAGGTAHAIVMTPVATDTNLNWTTSGSICDPDRGVKC